MKKVKDNSGQNMDRSLETQQTEAYLETEPNLAHFPEIQQETV